MYIETGWKLLIVRYIIYEIRICSSPYSNMPRLEFQSRLSKSFKINVRTVGIYQTIIKTTRLFIIDVTFADLVKKWYAMFIKIQFAKHFSKKILFPRLSYLIFFNVVILILILCLNYHVLNYYTTYIKKM